MMTSHAKALVIAVSLCLWSLPGLAQEKAPAPHVKALKLTDTIYELTCTSGYPVNALASLGPDGVLLVDTCFRETADEIEKTLSRLGGGPVRFIVNTHIHGDHVGGNGQLGEGAAIIAHPNTRKRLSGEYFSLPPAPAPGAPSLTVKTEIKLHFNGEEIRVFSPTGGHTDGDLVVHFTSSGVASLGDLLFSDSFPFVDVRRGGDAERHVRTLAELADELPPDTVVVAGHGPHISMDELRGYTAMLEKTISIVHKALAEGKTKEQIHQEGLLQPWASWSGDGLTSSESWISWITDSLERQKGLDLPSVCEPLTETLVSSGIAAAIEQYHRLATTQSDAFDFAEGQLNTLGYQLLGRGMTAEAVEILKLNVEAFPKSANVYDSLAEAQMRNGDLENAISNYERSLELDPSNENAAQELEDLRKPKR